MGCTKISPIWVTKNQRCLANILEVVAEKRLPSHLDREHPWRRAYDPLRGALQGPIASQLAESARLDFKFCTMREPQDQLKAA